MGEEGCGSLYPTCFLLTFTMLSLILFFCLFRKSRVRKGKKEKGSIFVFFALCLLPCLPLAFGFFLIFPESKSFKHLKLYMLIKK